MQDIIALDAMRAWTRAEQARGASVAFVPTMGFLHEGHLRLVDRARELADRVVLSIFVNPLQFGPGEDFERYPRDLPRDRALAQRRAVDVLFLPERAAMYPAEPVVRVTPGALGETLEALRGPAISRACSPWCSSCWRSCSPTSPCFGRKDFQQATLVRRMAADLDLPVTIDVAPTVRELDGLALSSRNAYLAPEERRAALALSRCLRAVEQGWRGGEASAAALVRRGLETLTQAA